MSESTGDVQFDKMSQLAGDAIDIAKAEKERSRILRHALKEIALMTINNEESAKRAQYIAIEAVRKTAVKEWPPEVVENIEKNWKV